MLDFFKNLFSAEFMPHGHCMFWYPEILWLHIISDALIALSYYSIPIALFYFVRKRNETEFHWIFLMFGAFILACGTNHLIDIWTLWTPVYRFEGIMKLLTASISVATAIAIWPLIPKAIDIPSPLQLEKINENLRRQIEERQNAEEQLQIAYANLEKVVEERTAELQLANEVLQDNEERLRILLQSMPNAIVLVDSSGKIELINQLAEAYFGYEQGMLIGQPLDILIPQRFKHNHANYFQDYWREQTPRAMGENRDLYARRKDGSEFPVEVGLTPCSINNKTFIVSSIIDITERKATQETIKMKSEALMNSNLELQQFAYVASHDLQEPLRTINNFTRSLEERLQGKLDENTTKYLHFIMDGAQRLDRLVADLLDFCRVDRVDQPLQPVNCNTVYGNVINTLDAAIQESKAIVNANELPTIMANPSQINQLFQNLIGNALKFRSKETPKINVTAEESEHEWTFRVQDNGVGIPEDAAEEIFVVFKRLHSRSEYSGTGIGLSICKKIVEHYGGKIWAESVPGKGTTFYFTFPKHDD